MRHYRLGLLVLQATLVVLLAIGLRTHWLPLGVPGQWEWLRVKVWPTPLGFLTSSMAVGLFAGFVALGAARLAKPAAVGWLRESAWVAGLFLAAASAQLFVQAGAADEYDLTKWAYVNVFESSTGYYKVAQEQMVGAPDRFLANYSDWIKSQDSLHIGTHPPGLIVAHWYLGRQMIAHPGFVEFMSGLMPPALIEGFRQVEQLKLKPVPRSDRVALFVAGLLTLAASAGTVIPLYLLAKAERSGSVAWYTAALWPLASAPVLFQPVADTAYPLFSTGALALAVWAGREGTGRVAGILLALLAGMILAVGMFCSLVFLAVGLIVAILIATSPSPTLARRAFLIVAVGLGFLGVTCLIWGTTRSNPFVIWWWNKYHHARFYDDYPRSYWAWFITNPIETAIALGLPSAVWCAAGFAKGWRGTSAATPTRSAWAALIVLVILNVVGKNLGEVARLWQPFMPPLLMGAAAGLHRLEAGPRTLGASVALIGLQTIVLQTALQVVYPV